VQAFHASNDQASRRDCLYSPGNAGMWVEPTLDWGGRGSSPKHHERASGVKMHQLSNMMRWFRLRAMWRIGGKPLQRVDQCAARLHDEGGHKKK